ncbi:hypothetical protein ABVK25_012097 [Lepraria finkii]|uniref:Rhodopsin domain-containing protein n=1 Tax=Lepraria finkii TaxID=1340010 RepID=A0ABR4AI23_9LECA
MANARLTAPLVIAAGAIWPPVCTTAVCLRFYTRHIQNNRLLADDWLLIPALILLVGMCASALRGVALHSVGYPTPKPASAYAEAHYASYQQQTTRKVLWSIELMQIPALGLIKLSFMFFYKRIFAKGKGAAFKATINGFVGLIIIWIIGFFFGYLFVCKAHPSNYWTSLYNEKLYCNNSTQLHLGYAISDFIFDFLIIAFPIPLVWSLHMSPGRKIGVTGIFALGILTIAASVTRMVVYIQSLNAEYVAKSDIDFLSTNCIYWCIIEIGCGLTAACLPTLYGLLHTKALESIVRSVRSIVSIGSSPSGSQRSQRSRAISSKRHQADESTTSHAEILSSTNPHDIEMEPLPQRNQIKVDKTFTAVEGPAEHGLYHSCA